MDTDIAIWNNAEQINALFTEIVKDISKLPKLTTILKSEDLPKIEDWPQLITRCWVEGIDLILDGLSRDKLTEEIKDFTIAASQVDLDTMLLRDFLATIIRNKYKGYFDPAGMIIGLGIYNNKVTPSTILKRIHLFSELKENLYCNHPTYGIGRISEIDQLLNEVYINFTTSQQFDLEAFLAGVIIIKKGSLIEKLVSKKITWSVAAKTKNFKKVALDSFIASFEVTDQMLARIIVPNYTTNNQYLKLITEKKVVEKDPNQREWTEARSIIELVQLLNQKDSPIIEKPENWDFLYNLFCNAAQRSKDIDQFIQAVCLMWKLASADEWFLEDLKAMKESCIAWTDYELFVSVCEKISGRILPSWYECTMAANGAEYLAQVCNRLPLRLWAHLVRTLNKQEDGFDLLIDAIGRCVSNRDISPDTLVWLWKNKKCEHRIALTDATLLFRTLARPTKGAYIKAKKELHKLLMENQDFQRFIMVNGDEAKVRELVRCIKRLPLLNSGDQQSLLVKIVRIFPECKYLVEERSQIVTRRAISKLTSMRSFEEKRLELEDIINNQIPANSRAIAHARSFGDLRENAEFKAAKERQAYLGARRAELEEGMEEIRPTDFYDVVVNNIVVPGCRVEFKYEDGNSDFYYLLGLWDSAPEKSIISYDTPIGKLLLGKSTGDVLEMPNGKTATITAISELPEEIKKWIIG